MAKVRRKNKLATVSTRGQNLNVRTARVRNPRLEVTADALTPSSFTRTNSVPTSPFVTSNALTPTPVPSAILPSAEIARGLSVKDAIDSMEMARDRAVDSSIAPRPPVEAVLPAKPKASKRVKSAMRRRNMQEIVDEIEAGRGSQYIKG